MGLRALIGLLAPLKVSGRLFLQAELRRLRPGKMELPVSVVDEFVDLAINVAALQHLGTIQKRAEVVTFLEVHAVDIARLLDGQAIAMPPDLSAAYKILAQRKLIP